MRKIAVVTATRAEYGLLSPVIKELRKFENDEFRIDLVVTGTHLSTDYGMTEKEIDDRIDHRIPVSVASSDEISISKNQAEVLILFTELFASERYDGVVLLGDRYETLAVAIAAGNTGTPIFHLCGGDTTEGAIDEWIRHSVTKMSYLHFVTNEESRKRVIQLGEDPARVFNYGATGVDNILSFSYMSRSEALESVGIGDCKYAICTFHPVTIGDMTVDYQIGELLKAISSFPDIEFIVTKSNADLGGARINELLDEAEGKIGNLHVYASLGVKRYLSLMKYCEFVLGNSSSGIMEAPALHVATVNIGDRQRGRLQPESVMNCGTSYEEIRDAINAVMTPYYKEMCGNVISPYGDGHAAEKTARKIYDTVMGGCIDLKKKFYDI